MSVDEYVHHGRSEALQTVTHGEIFKIAGAARLAAKAAAEELDREGALTDEEKAFLIELHRAGEAAHDGWVLCRPNPLIDSLKERGLCQQSQAMRGRAKAHDDEQMTSLTVTGLEVVINVLMAAREVQQPERQR